MAPQKFASMRYKTRPATLVPFRDDTNLIGLRYDQTVPAEPPIPIPPPRSPLRNRPTSCISSVATTNTNTNNPAAVVIPPPRPPPPAETHPALRTITTPRTNVNDPKRDSGHAPTTSSHSYTLHEESEDDGDPFAYEKIEVIHKVRVGVNVDAQRLDENDKAYQSLSGTNNNSQSSIPLPSPGLSDANTVSPESPTTPPPTFAERAGSIFSRPFSIHSSRSSMKSIRSKKLKKKSQPHPPGLVGDDDELMTPVIPPKEPNSTPALEDYNVPENDGRQSPLDDMESPKLSPAARHQSGDFSDFIKTMEFSKRGSIMLGGMRPHGPKKSFAMNYDDISEEQPTRFFPLMSSTAKPQTDGPSQSPIPESSESSIDHPKRDVIPEEEEEEEDEHGHGHEEQQPPVVDDNDETYESALGMSREMTTSPPLAASTPPPVPIVTLRSTTPENAPASNAPEDAPQTPRSPQQPPSLRFLPVNVERESQKVRSLYEPGDGLNFEDGGRLSSFSGRLEPTAEVPSEEDENDAPSQSQNPSHGGQPPGNPQAAAIGIPVYAARTVSLRDDSFRRAYELAGGIEDWEDVNGEDVDRYGFITSIRRPETRSGTPVSMDRSVQFSPRKQRNVLIRRDAVHSAYLTAKRGPSRKVSARSLHTQASEMSTASRQTTRSAVRQAANLLPHNRDRRWMDDAGDMLAIQPGLTSILQDQSAAKLADDYKHKEWERAEKWQKMAKVVNQDTNGEGMVFEFDTKSPKLIERTWKGIPDRWRAAAWFSFLSTSARNSKKYNIADEELISVFYDLQHQPSPDDVQIDLDVPRTISQHIMFRKRYRGGQRLLFRVLHALSLYFPGTGYVQGMASLAATLLSYYDEEKCFIMLVRLWQLRGLNRLYQPGFAELMGALDDFEKLWLGDKDVAKKLQELCINPTAYGTRWYLTLFNLSIPFSAQLRVWDVFMLLGESPPEPSDPAASSEKIEPTQCSSKGLEILHATSTAIINALSEQLVDAEFENAMKALTSWVPIKDEELLMKVVRAEYKHHISKAKKS